jgi:hypothetical protein
VDVLWRGLAHMRQVIVIVEQWSNWQGESSEESLTVAHIGPTCCITVFDSADVASNVHVICISGHLLLQQMHQNPWGYCSRTPHGGELLTQWLLVFRWRASIAVVRGASRLSDQTLCSS